MGELQSMFDPWFRENPNFGTIFFIAWIKFVSFKKKFFILYSRCFKWLWSDALICSGKYIFQKTLKGVKFYLNFSQYNFEKLIRALTNISHSASLELCKFISLSVMMNLPCLLKLCPLCWKCLEARMELGFLVSFLWSFSVKLNAVSVFLTYCILHNMHSIR